MSKLLATRLPQETEETVNGGTYNRLVRILELNLGEFDPDNIRQINSTDRGEIKFNAGSIVWNTSNEALEVYTGSQWLTLSTPQNSHGFEATGTVGAVTVKLDGATTITL
tara:strand:+ start:512 stop:841 length:330 start_codon:yes stop_codon:yes gene_type:complete